MPSTYILGMAARKFIFLLEHIPQSKIVKWEKKYQMEEEEGKNNSDDLREKRESRIIRVSSSAYIWR